MASNSKAPLAGGFLLALCLLAGAITGVFTGQASLGFLIGAGVGLAIVILLWLWDRKRT